MQVIKSEDGFTRRKIWYRESDAVDRESNHLTARKFENQSEEPTEEPATYWLCWLATVQGFATRDRQIMSTV